jgi:hypothetical protein
MGQGGSPNVGDVIVKKEAHITLVQRRKANGQDETTAHEKRPEYGVAKASRLACEGRVAVWLTDDGVNFELLDNYRANS